jgi:hypothetical protein
MTHVCHAMASIVNQFSIRGARRSMVGRINPEKLRHDEIDGFLVDVKIFFPF